MDILKILDIIKDPDLKIKISQLYGENLKLKDENQTLKKQVDKLKDNQAISSNLVHEDNHYFLLKKDKDKDGPFCTKCWDSDNKLIRLHKINENYGQEYFQCPNCKTDTYRGEINNPDVQKFEL